MSYKNIEERRKHCREYKAKFCYADPVYREKARAYSREWQKRRQLETPWLSHYKNAKQRCNNPNCKDYKYYGGKGVRMLLTELEIEILYKCCFAAGMKYPVIDRIDSDGDYNFRNCRFIENSENTVRINRASV